MLAALAVLGTALATIAGAEFLRRKGSRKVRVLGIIPARYGSTRFPGKPLALLGGKPMIQHTFMNSKRASCLTKLVVATDDEVRKRVLVICILWTATQIVFLWLSREFLKLSKALEEKPS